MTTNNLSEHWKLQLAKEHELRLQAEQSAKLANAALIEAQEALKKTKSFNDYIESKYNELEANFVEQANKFKHSISMLKKAKTLIIQRKTELNALKNENSKLQAALAQRTAALEEEMLQHEETNHKLANTLRKLSELQRNEINSLQIPTDKLEEYLTYKILSAPKSETISTDSLKSDTDFLAQLRYIEQQEYPSKL